ncbi:HAD superfamily phosphoserine phosphatase-like hydrolase [Neobacillus niacini]|uniref:HAD family hydrolase n=1 Tax=Neobacillus niacini TaxID=86668 RepID=UPI0027881C8D|nr:HAD-IB family phosphatase [Neobacillus niacini]MDQ1000800.1 HAD superfamily phosphoserine phosphatase-like hydrolase [Neobacillus niacini]
MKYIIFDICGTIYDANTSFAFIENVLIKYSRTYRTIYKILKSIPGRIINKILFKFFNYDLFKQVTTRFLRNHSEEFIANLSKEFVLNHLKPKERKDVINLLNQYKGDKWKVVFISGAYDFIVKEVANFYGVDDYYASTLETKNGIYTGRYKDDILDKKHVIFQSNFKDVEELIVVSDNKTDYELFKLAKNKYVITNKRDMAFWSKKDLGDVQFIKVGS